MYSYPLKVTSTVRISGEVYGGARQRRDPLERIYALIIIASPEFVVNLHFAFLESLATKFSPSITTLLFPGFLVTTNLGYTLVILGPWKI